MSLWSPMVFIISQWALPTCQLWWSSFWPLTCHYGSPTRLNIRAPILHFVYLRLRMHLNDSTLCTAAIHNTLTAHVKPLYCWINVNQMVLNVDKTEGMLLGILRLNRALNDISMSENEYIITPVNTLTHTHKHTHTHTHTHTQTTWSTLC